MIGVGGFWWHLELVPSNHPKLKRSDGILTLGATDWNDKTIYICETLNSDMFDKVLCHELTHVFCFSYDCGMTIEQEELCAWFLSTYGREVFNVADNVICRYMSNVI